MGFANMLLNVRNAKRSNTLREESDPNVVNSSIKKIMLQALSFEQTAKGSVFEKNAVEELKDIRNALVAGHIKGGDHTQELLVKIGSVLEHLDDTISNVSRENKSGTKSKSSIKGKGKGKVTSLLPSMDAIASAVTVNNPLMGYSMKIMNDMVKGLSGHMKSRSENRKAKLEELKSKAVKKEELIQTIESIENVKNTKNVDNERSSTSTLRETERHEFTSEETRTFYQENLTELRSIREQIAALERVVERSTTHQDTRQSTVETRLHSTTNDNVSRPVTYGDKKFTPVDAPNSKPAPVYASKEKNQTPRTEPVSAQRQDATNRFESTHSDFRLIERVPGNNPMVPERAFMASPRVDRVNAATSHRDSIERLSECISNTVKEFRDSNVSRETAVKDIMSRVNEHRQVLQSNTDRSSTSHVFDSRSHQTTDNTTSDVRENSTTDNSSVTRSDSVRSLVSDATRSSVERESHASSSKETTTHMSRLIETKLENVISKALDGVAQRKTSSEPTARRSEPARSRTKGRTTTHNNTRIVSDRLAREVLSESFYNTTTPVRVRETQGDSLFQTNRHEGDRSDVRLVNRGGDSHANSVIRNNQTNRHEGDRSDVRLVNRGGDSHANSVIRNNQTNRHEGDRSSVANARSVENQRNPIFSRQNVEQNHLTNNPQSNSVVNRVYTRNQTESARPGSGPVRVHRQGRMGIPFIDRSRTNNTNSVTANTGGSTVNNESSLVRVRPDQTDTNTRPRTTPETADGTMPVLGRIETNTGRALGYLERLVRVSERDSAARRSSDNQNRFDDIGRNRLKKTKTAGTVSEAKTAESSGGLLGALGGMIPFLVSKLLSPIKTMGKLFGLLGGVVATTLKPIQWAIDLFGTIGKSVTKVFGFIGKAFEIVMKPLGWIANMIGTLAKPFLMIGKLLSKFTVVITIVAGVYDFVDGFIRSGEIMGRKMSGIGEKIEVGIASVISGLIEPFNWLAGLFGAEFFHGTKDQLTKSIVDFCDNFVSSVKNLFTDTVDMFKEFFTATWKKIKDMGNAVWENTFGRVSNLFGGSDDRAKIDAEEQTRKMVEDKKRLEDDRAKATNTVDSLTNVTNGTTRVSMTELMSGPTYVHRLGSASPTQASSRSQSQNTTNVNSDNRSYAGDTSSRSQSQNTTNVDSTNVRNVDQPGSRVMGLRPNSGVVVAGGNRDTSAAQANTARSEAWQTASSTTNNTTHGGASIVNAPSTTTNNNTFDASVTNSRNSDPTLRGIFNRHDLIRSR